MGAIDNLNNDEMRGIIKRLERLERAAPVGFSTVSRGALIIKSIEGLIVEGSAKITGILTGAGQFLWNGIVTLTSTFTATGTTRFEGDTTQQGPFHIEGATDLTGTMTVASGGKVTVAGSDPVSLGVTSSGAPGIEWSSGGRVVGGASSASMTYSDKTVNVGAAGAILANAANRVVITASGTTIEGALFNDLPTISATGRTPNVWCDPSTKRFYRLI